MPRRERASVKNSRRWVRCGKVGRYVVGDKWKGMGKSNVRRLPKKVREGFLLLELI